MKSKSETRESYETKKVTKTEKYFVLEDIDDLKDPDFPETSQEGNFRWISILSR